MAVSEERRALETDLRRLAARGIDRMFERVGDEGPLDLPTLFGIVSSLRPDQWGGDQEQKADTIEATILQASEELKQPIFPGHWMTRKYMAQVMFDLRKIDPDRERRNHRPKRYATLIAVLKEELGLSNSRNFDRETRRTRELLAQAILELAEEMEQDFAGSVKFVLNSKEKVHIPASSRLTPEGGEESPAGDNPVPTPLVVEPHIGGDEAEESVDDDRPSHWTAAEDGAERALSFVERGAQAVIRLGTFLVMLPLAVGAYLGERFSLKQNAIAVAIAMPFGIASSITQALLIRNALAALPGGIARLVVLVWLWVMIVCTPLAIAWAIGILIFIRRLSRGEAAELDDL